MRVCLLADLRQVLDFILDHFRFNPGFVNQFPGEYLAKGYVVKLLVSERISLTYFMDDS
jgi:hypothetical protein